MHFPFELDVTLLFGLTELKAHIAWMEDIGIFALCFFEEIRTGCRLLDV